MSLSLVRAQFVTIPDANMVTYLQGLVPAAMSGNQLDTTHVAVTTTTTGINCNTRNISNLYGIQFFSSLKYLNCQNNSATSIPPLPATTQTLICTGNPLSTLPALPAQFKRLECAATGLTVLPNLPSGLNYLDCSYDSLTIFPSITPPGLDWLNCSYNMLTALPNLSGALTHLECNNNQISNISGFGAALTFLDCSNNSLSSLPALPGGLLTFNCSSNNFTSLPALPNTITSMQCGSCPNLTTLPTLPSSLITLECPYNQFTSLPAFPNSIKYLNIFYTYVLATYPAWPTSLLYVDCSAGYNITSLPSFPNMLQHLDCSFNPHLKSLPALPNSLNYLNTGFDSIYCFPVFPANIYTIAITPNNVVTCLPNYLPSMDAATLALPLCQSGNPNSCPAAVGIDEPAAIKNFVSVFPNPSPDFITIWGEKIEDPEMAVVQIYNNLGEIVRTQKFNKILSISDLAVGSYMLQIITSKGEIRRTRFIKE